MATSALTERVGASGAMMATSLRGSSSPSAAAMSLGMVGHRRSGGVLVAVGRSMSGRRAAGSALVCRSSLRGKSSGNVVEFQSEEEFNTILEDAGDKLVVLDISTTTCGPCRMIFPKLVEMSLEYPDAVFLKINGDINNDTRTLMRKWGVRAVPNFRFFKKGEQVHTHTGGKVDELKAQFAAHYGQPIKV